MPTKTLLRNARPVSGLVLMALVINHLAKLSLGLHSLAMSERRSLAMSRTDVVQFLLGLLTPPGLIDPSVKVFRCKFETAPGKQFDVRAQALQRLEAGL